MQQVLAFETDLLEYEDIFDGSHVIEEMTSRLRAEAQAELDEVLDLGGAFSAIDTLKSRLVSSMAERTRRIASSDQVVVGVNRFTESETGPLGGSESILRVDPEVEQMMVDDLVAWKSERDEASVAGALDRLRSAAQGRGSIMEASIDLARVGGTTGEWGAVMREVFGEFRAPTGISGATGSPGGLAAIAERVRALPGGPPRVLIAKPGLDGHSNGAEQIAMAARDSGMEVVYAGIRSTVDEIAATAVEEDPDLIGLSILSGSHLELVPRLVEQCRALGVTAPIVVGGIIPEEDRAVLAEAGVAAVYTPKDFDLVRIMDEFVSLVIPQ